MNPKNKGLGRGLGAIFEIEGKDLPAKKSNHAFEEVEIASVVPNPKQPRTHFDEQALGELAESIRTLGVIQPLTVKKEDDGKYTIISGERRWRASQLAGLETVPGLYPRSGRPARARNVDRGKHPTPGPQCDRGGAKPAETG